MTLIFEGQAKKDLSGFNYLHYLDAGMADSEEVNAMVKITEIEALQRTKKMLVREWYLSEEPTSVTDLHKAPPNGLGQNDSKIRALETPIETNDF